MLYGIRVSRQVDTAWHHVCGPTSGGPHADRQRGPKQTSCSTFEARKRNHYARPGQVSFDERSYKIATLAVKSLGRLRQEGSDLIDHVAASIVGGTDGSSL